MKDGGASINIGRGIFIMDDIKTAVEDPGVWAKISDGMETEKSITFGGECLKSYGKGEDKMKMNDVLQEVKAELAAERKEAAKEILKERLQDVQEIKRAAAIAEEQLNRLLEMDIDDVISL